MPEVIEVTKLKWNYPPDPTFAKIISYVNGKYNSKCLIRIEYLLKEKKWLVQLLDEYRVELLEGTIHDMEIIQIAAEALLVATVQKLLIDLK